MARKIGTFVEFPVGITDHPRVATLTDGAFHLWWTSIFWCASQKADNLWVPSTALKELRGTKRAANELAVAGLWLADDGGYFLIRNDLWRVRVAYTSRDRIPGWMRDIVLERDGYACLGCGAQDDLQMDHVFPYSRGGKTTIENLQTLCGPCNRTKGARV